VFLGTFQGTIPGTGNVSRNVPRIMPRRTSPLRQLRASRSGRVPVLGVEVWGLGFGAGLWFGFRVEG